MSTQVPAPVLPRSQDPVAAFVDGLARRDFEAIRHQLADDVWFRALLTRELHESATSEAALAALRSWFGGAKSYALLSSERHTVGGREHLSFRVLLKPDWAPDRWHVIEQSGYCRVRDGRISRLDLACTGFFPVPEEGSGSGG